MSRRAAERTGAIALLALALAVAGAGPARAAEPPPAGGGALRVVADPPRPVLSGDVAVALRVSAPADAEDLSLTASAGTIAGLRRLPGGGFEARYLPPAERVPQVAIVAAMARTGRGVEDGWVAIPMSGHGIARVHAEPGEPVSLRIGDRLFGPQPAGEDGVAAIPIVVPPGIREAHRGYRPIDLEVPDTSLVHAIADRAVVRADREERVRVAAYVVAPHGVARRGDRPSFEPSRGTVALSEREAGAWVGAWTLPPGPAGEERLVVRLPSAPASRAVVRVTSVPGPAAVVAVSVDPPALVAGGEGATVTARALDGAGNVVPAALTLAAEGGALGPVEVKRPGEVRAALRPATTLRAPEVVITASAPAVGLAGSRAVPLRPAAPATARFARRELVRGDGRRATVLRVVVADRFGNPVAAAPEVTAARGEIVGVKPAGPGAFDVRYVPAAVARPEPDALVARIGEVRATLAPVVAPPPPALRVEALAGPVLDLRGRFGGAAGLVAAERPVDLDAALRAGLEPALRLEVAALAGTPAGARAALLAGPALRRDAGAARVGLALSGGALLGGAAAGPAARLALSVGLARPRAEPFLELSLLAARGAAPGPFVAAGLAVGVRLGLEGSSP